MRLWPFFLKIDQVSEWICGSAKSQSIAWWCKLGWPDEPTHQSCNPIHTNSQNALGLGILCGVGQFVTMLSSNTSIIFFSWIDYIGQNLGKEKLVKVLYFRISNQFNHVIVVNINWVWLAGVFKYLLIDYSINFIYYFYEKYKKLLKKLIIFL